MAKAKDVKWLKGYIKASRQNAKWLQGDETKTRRLKNMEQEIEELADEIKFLSTYDIDVKAFVFFSKTIPSMSKDQSTWDPNSEVDTGRDVSRMKKAIPKEVMDRLMAAQNRILGMQASLQSPIDRQDWSKVQQEFANEISKRLTEFDKQNHGPAGLEDLKSMREEVANELAAKFKCGANEILQIELEGSLSDETGALPWKLIKEEMHKATEKADAADELLKKLEKQLKASQDKPDSVRQKLEKQIEEQRDACSAAHKNVAETKKELAEKHAHGEEFRIDEIVAWQPLFSDIELRLELWKPLMRAGVIADNTIPDAYNETVQVFRGSSELYNARGERDAPDESTKGKTASALKGSKQLLDKVSQISENVIEAAGGPSIIVSFIEAGDAIAGALLSGGKAVIEKDIEGVFDSVGDLLGGALSAVTDDSQMSAVLASAVESAYSAGNHGAKAIHKLVVSKGQDWRGVLNELAEGVAETLSTIGESDPSLEMLTTVGKNIESAIKGADLGAAIIKAMSKDPPDVEAIVEAFSEVCDSAISAELQTAKQLVDDDLDNEKEQALQSIDDNQNLSAQEKEDAKAEIENEYDSQVEDVETSYEEDLTDHSNNVTLIKSGNEALLKKVLKNIEAQEKRKADEEVETAVEDFKSELALGFGAADGGALETVIDMTSLDRMIEQINRDRALLKMAEAIFDTGVKTAAEFFEPLKMASSGKDFVKNLIMAVRRAIELNEWIDLKEDALKAASVQGFAFANRVRNLKVQVSKRTLDALYELAQLVGAATSCSGIASAAGIAVSKGAKALQILTDLVYKYGQKAELKRQWHLYKRCLENPFDRSAMRDCLHGNPTLSKYAMAYGAVIENDAIAMEGMRKCGINEASLKNPSTDCDKVVAYLETKFNDDPTLVRRLKKQSWQAADVELTVSSWMANKERAEKDKHVGFSPEGSGAIDLALSKVESAKSAFEEGLKALPEQRKAYGTSFDNFGPIAEKYKTAYADFNGAKAKYETFKQEVDKRRISLEKTDPSKIKPRDVVDLVAKIDEMLAMNKTLVKRAEDTDAELTRFADAIDPFKVEADKFLKTLTKPKFVEDYRKNLHGLIEKLKGFKPLAKGEKGEPLQPCDAMASYLDGLVAKAEIALVGLKREADEIERTHSEVEEQLGEALDHQKEVTTRRQQLARSRFVPEFDYEMERQELLRGNAELFAADKALKKLESFPTRVKSVKSPKQKKALKDSYAQAKDLFSKQSFAECVQKAESLLKALDRATKPKVKRRRAKKRPRQKATSK